MLEQELENRLKQAFPGADVMVSDMTGGGSNFEVRIIAPQFQDMNRVREHQQVMAVFDAELKSGELHALSIKSLAK